MARFDDMRASSRFSRPFGMPEMDDDSLHDILRQISPVVSSMKNDDLFRQKQLMEFENSLRRQNMGMQDAMRRRSLPDPTKKNWVVNYGGPVKLPPSTVEADNAARDARAAQVNREFAAVNALREERQATRASAEKIAADKLAAETAEHNTQRNFTAEQNKLNREQKSQPYMIDDPNDPTKKIAVRWNPATETVEPLKFGDQTVTNLIKPGTPPRPGKFVQPKNLSDIRAKVNAILPEFDNLLDKDDQLTSKGSSAFGTNQYFRWVPGSDAKSGRGSVVRIQAQEIINLIDEMKNQSATGATGFGAMNKDELAVLQNAASKLSDPYISDEDGRKELKRLRDNLKKILQDEAAEQPLPDEPGTRSTGRRPKLDPDKMLEKY